ncbi:hypothetical protein GCM10017559_64930 [Streptosporangium longisporum]|uniref:Uncharacterized protein n=1 Tax=Streptosporangium longisporum TaxID=46187 RepID=A0ABP6L2U5_9ACTN
MVDHQPDGPGASTQHYYWWALRWLPSRPLPRCFRLAALLLTARRAAPGLR